MAGLAHNLIEFDMKKTSFRLVMRVSQGAFVVALAALGGGCASVTGHHEPLAQVALSDLKLPEASAQARANWPKNGWWRQYRDEQLNALIEQAFADSLLIYKFWLLGSRAPKSLPMV